MNGNQSQGTSASASASSSASATTSNSTAQADEYFDLHVKGCGYLSRVRAVPVGRGGRETFLACAISAMHGLCNDPSYSYFDLKVTGTAAETLIRDLWKDVNDGRKVFVAFRAGDVYADPYEAEERDRETCMRLRGPPAREAEDQAQHARSELHPPLALVVVVVPRRVHVGRARGHAREPAPARRVVVIVRVHG